MLTKKRLPLTIALVFILESLIYLWARFATEADFVIDKCARNSGRVSSMLVLAILLVIGYFGLKKIVADPQMKNAFRVLITLFTINHFIHFGFVYLNFKQHEIELSIAENLHGFVTFLGILIVPVLLWSVQKVSRLLQIIIIVHLFNVSYFIMETFASKVKPGIPAYHNQLGIAVISLALVFVLYRVVRENFTKSIDKNS